MTVTQPRWINARRLGPWLVAGLIAWAGAAWIGWTLWQGSPPKAGFDLSLLLDAARRVTVGQSPYEPAMLAGTSPAATELFYSYPPPVAQAMTVLTGLSNGAVLVLWAIGATAGLGLVTAFIARAFGRNPVRMAVRAVAVAPLVLPFAIAMLFGNLDAWYPLAYGALLLTVLPGASARTHLAGGVAVAVATVAKLHPALLLLWMAARAFRDRGGPQARAFGAAAATWLAIVVLSLAVGGLRPWQDYVQIVRAGAGAGLVDARNVGPVSLLGQVMGLSGSVLQLLQVVVVLAVVAVTMLAAWHVRDPVTSVALASAASLVTLPVTWYHYPVALIPLAIALAIGHPAARPRLVLAVVIADVAIAYPPLLWLAVAVLLVACVESARRTVAQGAPVAA